MGDILFLAHRLPYPPDRGDRIRSWHVLQALAKLAPVHVVAPFDEENDEAFAKVSEIAKSVFARRRPTGKLRAIARALCRNTPASVEAFWLPELQLEVNRLAATGYIDTIYTFSGQMGAYWPMGYFDGRLVMDFVDMDSAKFAALGGWPNRQEARRLQAYEAQSAYVADVSLFVSRAEADLFESKTGLRADVLENGIDLLHFAPGIVAPQSAPHPLIVFTGQMDYGPNIEAVTGFARTALPQIRAAIPDATFVIVGRAPTAAVKALANDHVIVTGEVPDTRPWLAAADVVVAPLSLARGVQNKVLEAMAMARPVIVSSGAGQGIDAEDGRDLIIADQPADAVITLLQDKARAGAIGQAARARMVARYAWDAQLAPLAGFVGR